MGEHIDAEGRFQSDKYPWCKPGFVPLKITDPGAWAPLWNYAERRRDVDTAFADDLQACLRAAGYKPPIYNSPTSPPAHPIITGLFIEAGWQKVEGQARNLGASTKWLGLYRHAFFLGAHHLFAVVIPILKRGLKTGEDFLIVEPLERELSTFGKETGQRPFAPPELWP